MSNTLVLGSREEVAASLPHTIGFYPDDSIVVLCLDASSVIMMIRLSLPETAERSVFLMDAPTYIASSVNRLNANRCILVLFSESTDDFAYHQSVMVAAEEAVSEAGILLSDAFIVRREEIVSVLPQDTARKQVISDETRAKYGSMPYNSRADVVAAFTPRPDEAVANAYDKAAESFGAVMPSARAMATVQLLQSQPFTDENKAHLIFAFQSEALGDYVLSDLANLHARDADAARAVTARLVETALVAPKELAGRVAAYAAAATTITGPAVEVLCLADIAGSGYAIMERLSYVLDGTVTPATFREVCSMMESDARRKLAELDAIHVPVS